MFVLIVINILDKFSKQDWEKLENKLPFENENKNQSLVDVSLITGRHHQIRVQFAHIGHPLVGDGLYGSKVKQPICLHAYYLSFLHPITQEKLEFYDKPNWKEEVL